MGLCTKEEVLSLPVAPPGFINRVILHGSSAKILWGIDLVLQEVFRGVSLLGKIEIIVNTSLPDILPYLPRIQSFLGEQNLPRITLAVPFQHPDRWHTPKTGTANQDPRIPFVPTSPDAWHRSLSKQYRQLLKTADKVVYVDRDRAYNHSLPAGYHINKYKYCDEWMIDYCLEASGNSICVALWDGRPGLGADTLDRIRKTSIVTIPMFKSLLTRPGELIWEEYHAEQG